jgi:hypothetical protein
LAHTRESGYPDVDLCQNSRAKKKGDYMSVDFHFLNVGSGANKNWTNEGLQKAIRKQYHLIDEIFHIASDKRISIHFPFAGVQIGPFHVLSPTQCAYQMLLPQFDRTPPADQAAIGGLGWWLQQDTVEQLVRQIAGKAVAKGQATTRARAQ